MSNEFSPPTLASLRERFPWTPEQLRLGRPLEWCWQAEVDATPQAMWPGVADTSRLNRRMGFPRLNYREEAGQLKGESRYWGIPVAWVEEPWRWVENRELLCVRHYSRGFAHVFRGACTLDALPGNRSLVTLYFAWIPRRIWWRFFLKTMFSQLRPVYLRAIRRVADQAAGRPTQPRQPRHDDADPGRTARVAVKTAEIVEAGITPELAASWSNLIDSGDPIDLYRIRPKALARLWDRPLGEVLDSALTATAHGMLLLRWDLVCPHCRGTRSSLDSLASLPKQQHCDVCNIDFATNRSESIEITFRPHPSLREVDPVFYCAAEPAQKPHIAMQLPLPPGGQETLTLSLAAEGYRARLGATEIAEIRVDPAAAHKATWTIGGGVDPKAVANDVTLSIRNEGATAAQFIVERTHWAADAVRPGEVVMRERFRRLFHGAFVPPDIELDIGRLVVVFTDVVASSAIFRDHGDATALMLMSEHFRCAGQLAADHGGTLVKTIGDATLMVFPEAAGAVTATAMLVDYAALAGLGVRAGIHMGPCLAVQLNTGIDVFGTTVITAARLQRRAGPGEIVLSNAVGKNRQVVDWLAKLKDRTVELTVDLPELAIREDATRVNVVGAFD